MTNAKPIIAVDIDDVLSASAEEFIAFSNQHFDTQLTIDDYDEDWLKVWRVDLAEGLRRRDKYFALSNREHYMIKVDAQKALRLLAARFKLVVVTSRLTILTAPTQRWLNHHFAGLFEAVEFTGTYEGDGNVNRVTHTKTELLQQLGASFLIDDQLKHCTSAAEVGIAGVLFGNYSWNQSKNLPKGVTRCTDWATVLEYFDGR